MNDLADRITAAGTGALTGRKGFAGATGVSDEDRRAERAEVRKAANPGSAERVSLRLAKVVTAFKQAEGRSPGQDDEEVWKALAKIVKDEVGGA